MSELVEGGGLPGVDVIAEDTTVHRGVQLSDKA